MFSCGVYGKIVRLNLFQIAEKEPGKRFDFEAFKAESLDPDKSEALRAEINRKVAKGIALSTHEKAILAEEDEAREIDPFEKLEHGIDQAFIALREGRITAEYAEQAIKAMLKTQRNELHHVRQEKYFAEKAKKLGED